MTVVIHAFAQPANLPRATSPATRPADSAEPRAPRHRKASRTGRHHRDERTWLDLLNDILHSWPLTWRVVILIAAVATGTTAVVMALGLGGQLALAGLAALGRHERQRRTQALRSGRDLPRRTRR